MVIPVKLEVFEGPLDLLLHLIEKNKVDIYDIPIVSITDQYMVFIRQMEHEDLSAMSEFMLMAATLLDIKCRMLLPKQVNEEGEIEDPRADLVEKLLEYKTYKYMSGELRQMLEQASGACFREPDIPAEIRNRKEPVDPVQLLGGMTLSELNRIFESIVRRKQDRVDPIRSTFGRIVKEPVNVSQKLSEIRNYALEHTCFSFEDLIEDGKDRFTMVVTFLSILELIKMGHIKVIQERLFDDIRIEVLNDPESWKDLSDYKDEG